MNAQSAEPFLELPQLSYAQIHISSKIRSKLAVLHCFEEALALAQFKWPRVLVVDYKDKYFFTIRLRALTFELSDTLSIDAGLIRRNPAVSVCYDGHHYVACPDLLHAVEIRSIPSLRDKVFHHDRMKPGSNGRIHGLCPVALEIVQGGGYEHDRRAFAHRLAVSVSGSQYYRRLEACGKRMLSLAQVVLATVL